MYRVQYKTEIDPTLFTVQLNYTVQYRPKIDQILYSEAKR